MLETFVCLVSMKIKWTEEQILFYVLHFLLFNSIEIKIIKNTFNLSSICRMLYPSRNSFLRNLMASTTFYGMLYNVSHTPDLNIILLFSQTYSIYITSGNVLMVSHIQFYLTFYVLWNRFWVEGKQRFGI